MNQLLLQYYHDYFYRCKLQSKLPVSGDKSAHLHPKQRGPPKASLPFTQDTVSKKTRFQNVNPLLSPIFFIRMKSRRPHLAHFLVPGSRGLDSFARLSPLRIPFILFASSQFLLLSPAQWSSCCCWCAVTARSEWCFWDTTATLKRTQPSLSNGGTKSLLLWILPVLVRFFSPPLKPTSILARYSNHQKPLASLLKPSSSV